MKSDFTIDPLLQTKLYRPRIDRSLVARDRLLARLEKASDQRLILVSAPAGYGKTMLIDGWLEETTRPYAWLSLDANDNNLGLFVAYVVAALRQHKSTIAPTAQAVAKSAELPQAERLADIFLDEMAALDEPLWLVLDDYHLLQAREIHDFMARVVARLPRTLRLVLITRSDPPFPLARLRARGQLAEVRAAHLRFTLAEAEALLSSVSGTAVDPAIVQLLCERTEGWPTGLQMAALALRESDDADLFAQRFAASSHRLVHEYLIDEVLATLSVKQRNELLRAAIPDRFCAGLFFHLTGTTESDQPGSAYMASLWRANLFVEALDDEGIWFRFHALFQMLLRQRLQQVESAATVAVLHQRASNWFAEQGLIEPAIEHALQSDDPAAAAHLLQKNLGMVLNQDAWQRLQRWLRHFPASESHPAVLIGRAFLLHYSFQHAAVLSAADALVQTLDRAAISEEERLVYQGLINVLYSAAYRNALGDRERALSAATAARRQLTDEFAGARSLAESNNIIALQTMGKKAAARQLAEQLLAQQAVSADARSLRLLVSTCSLYYADADLSGLETLLPLYSRLAEEADHAIGRCWSAYGWGWLHYQRNELGKAQTYFEKALQVRHEANGRAVLDAYTGLALTHVAQNQQVEALAAVLQLRTFLQEHGRVQYLPVATALAAAVAIRGGQFDPARQSVGGFTQDAARQIMLGLWGAPVLTAVRVYLADGSPAALEQAQSLLRICRSTAAEWHSTRQLIEIGALEALAQAAAGDEEAALETLATAVLLSQAGGALRLILDAGPDLEPLLRRLLARNVVPAKVRRLLAGIRSQPALATPPTTPLLSAQGALGASLTNREVDVLLLLAERMTNKEIAERLSLSPNTVKKHAISLYGKLGVNSRRQAVMRARELQLLPEGL